MIQILHIVSDDQFIDDAIRVMDAVTNVSSVYVCPVKDECVEQGLMEIKSKERVSVIPISTFKHLLEETSIDIVAFHALPFWLYEYVLQIPKAVKIWWLIWGYDIYTDSPNSNIAPIVPLKLYKPITLSYVKSQLPLSSTAYEYIKKQIKILVSYNGNRDRVIKEKRQICNVKLMRQRVLERIDYISTVLPIEYEMLSKIKGIRAKYIPFQYPFKAKDTAFPKDPDASYILVGNSRNRTNNHLDVIKTIRERSINNTLYLPLAYNDDANYLQFLLAQIGGQENLLIQDDFVTREKYISLLGKCKAAVFGHIRQQALGTIGMMMMLGLKIFLYKDSICYKYFKANGYKVFSIEKDLNQKSIDQTLSEEDAEVNRVKIHEMFSYERVQCAMNDFFSEANWR